MSGNQSDIAMVGAAAGIDAETLGMIHLSRLHLLEVDALASIAADPAGLFNSALFAGINAGLFADDMLAIYAGMYHAFERGRDQFYAAITVKTLLRRTGDWSDADHFGGGSEWTAKRLMAFFDSWPASRATVERNVRALVEHVDRLREIDEHLGAARELLALRIEDVRQLRRRGLGVSDFIEQEQPKRIAMAA